MDNAPSLNRRHPIAMKTPEDTAPDSLPPALPDDSCCGGDSCTANECTDVAIAPSGDPKEDAIIRRHVLWSLSAGLIPVPVADIAAVAAIQLDALRQLANHHKVEYGEDTGKAFVTALTGGTLARLGASALKAIPGVGTVLGGLSMAGLSAASTYAVCQVASRQFRTGRSLLDENLERAKDTYQEALEKGKKFVQQLKERGAERKAEETSTTLAQLESLRDKGLLTAEEFEAKKAAALEQLDQSAT